MDVDDIIDPIGISNICRYCLGNDMDLRSIFEEEEGYAIIDITATCIGIMIPPDDEFSKYICETCLKQLLACNRFRKQCLQSMENLGKVHVPVSIKTEDDIVAHPIITPVAAPIVTPIVTSVTASAAPPITEVKPFTMVDCVLETIKKEKDDASVKHTDDIILDPQKLSKSEGIPKPCPYCGELRVDLRKHIRRLHPTVDVEPQPRRKKSNKVQRRKKKPEIKKEKVEVKKEKKPARQTVCYICGISVTCLSNHMISHNIDGVEYGCDYCGTSFKSKYTLMAHFKIHLNKRDFKCTKCPKTFNLAHSLKVHMYHHTGEKRYECETCHRKFARASGLSKHIPSHLKIYKFPCSICGKLFTRTSGRKKHERTHSDEHPYACQYCPKTFKASSSYSVHMTKHFKQNPLKCDICGGSFYRLSDYNTHKRHHEYNVI